VVFVSSSEQPVEPHEKLLRRVYELTDAEARFTALLLQGRKLEDIAETLAISIHTARSHLKHVFEKTRTSRQGELISLLLSGPVLLRLR
jgi:DNA-binding CsgD family transcriptional regulator